MKGVTVPTRKLEKQLWLEGHEVVIGMDEVGRGCAAGPVTVAAVVLPTVFRLKGLRDSKFMLPGIRETAATTIRRKALAIGIGWASSNEIDTFGLTAALRLAGGRALTYLGDAGVIVLDGNHNYLGDGRVRTCIKADQSCSAVAAASVIAKVARDRYMTLLHRTLPQYGFLTNKGYGSAEHMAALRVHGPSRHHRQLWKSVAGIGVND